MALDRDGVPLATTAHDRGIGGDVPAKPGATVGGRLVEQFGAAGQQVGGVAALDTQVEPPGGRGGRCGAGIGPAGSSVRGVLMPPAR
jgi:hypothetical protein